MIVDINNKSVAYISEGLKARGCKVNGLGNNSHMDKVFVDESGDLEVLR